MKHVTQICAVAIVICSPGFAEVQVEFDASGNLIVKDQIRTFATTTAKERTFVHSGSGRSDLRRSDERERLFDYSETGEILYETDRTDAEEFKSTSTNERQFRVPVVVLAPAPMPKEIVDPIPAETISPRMIADPVASVEPSVGSVQVAAADPLKLEDLIRIQSVSFDNIPFETGSAKLRPAAYAQLDHIAAAMNRDPELKVKIVGHTDNVGTQDDNQRLSERRAAAVVGALTQRYGVDPARLESSGRGETNPVDTNDTAEGRARNRRVEFIGRS